MCPGNPPKVSKNFFQQFPKVSLGVFGRLSSWDFLKMLGISCKTLHYCAIFGRSSENIWTNSEGISLEIPGDIFDGIKRAFSNKIHVGVYAKISEGISQRFFQSNQCMVCK